MRLFHKVFYLVLFFHIIFLVPLAFWFPQELRQVFDRADTTKSGTLTLAELKAAFCRADPLLPDTAVEEIMTMLDLEAVGSVSFEEVGSSVRLARYRRRRRRRCCCCCCCCCVVVVVVVVVVAAADVVLLMLLLLFQTRKSFVRSDSHEACLAAC